MRWTFILTVAACSSAPAKPTPPPPAPVVPIVAAPPDAAPDAGPDPIVVGAQLYETKACKACHTVDGNAGVGATMRGFFGTSVQLADGSSVVADEVYVRESILKPTVKMRAGFPPSMPEYESVLAPGELDALVAYIRSLR